MKKLLNSTLWGLITFLIIYILLSVGFRTFEITSIYNSHMIAGIIGTILGVLVFFILLLKK